MTHSERIDWAFSNLNPVQARYWAVWQDPDDTPCRVTIPTPQWVAGALHGGICPPVWIYHMIDDALETDEHGVTHSPLNFLHDIIPPIPAMTQEQAIEYIIAKDVPRRVWQAPSNRPRFTIIPAGTMPKSREHRNDWKIDDGVTTAWTLQGSAVEIDMVA